MSSVGMLPGDEADAVVFDQEPGARPVRRGDIDQRDGDLSGVRVMEGVQERLAGDLVVPVVTASLRPAISPMDTLTGVWP